jgi:hypothetical protein
VLRTGEMIHLIDLLCGKNLHLRHLPVHYNLILVDFPTLHHGASN